MKNIFEEIVNLTREGLTAALATVVSVRGSAPRKEGAKMLIKSDGKSLGSIGGGSAEAIIYREAMSVIAGRKPKLLHFDMTGRDTSEERMVCGGTMDVFIEPIAPPPALYIFGSGSISSSLTKIAKIAEFRVIIIDDRPDFITKEKFPEADEIYSQDYSSVFGKLRIDKDSYIVIATRSHAFDELVLEQALSTEARYIGMVASKRKAQVIFSHLKSKGISEEMLKRVYAPIGLEIQAETPEEIAISILAQIIKFRRAS